MRNSKASQQFAMLWQTVFAAIEDGRLTDEDHAVLWKLHHELPYSSAGVLAFVDAVRARLDARAGK